MTTFLEGAVVPVSEVARRCGLTPAEVEAEAAALGFYVGTDWAGVPALATQDARGLADGSARRNSERHAAHEAHLRAVEEHQAAREKVRRDAFDEAWKAALSAGYGNPVAADQGHAAAREAVADFDRANPEPVFAEPESRVKSWVRKVTAGAR